MTNLLIIGTGYCGQALAKTARTAGWDARCTYRNTAPLPAKGFTFSQLHSGLDWASHVVMTAPPDETGDPVLRTALPFSVWGGMHIVYLSTTGVYGDRDGAWVDEATPLAPQSDRSRWRLVAEQGWAGLTAHGAQVDLCRLGGIYGPGRSAFDSLRAGTAQRILKPGHSFSRIHVDDIVRAVLAALAQPPGPTPRCLNLVDDIPAEQAEVIAHAAHLLQMPVPPAIPFADAAATMSPMGRSFWAENRRVACAETKRLLGIDWLYPDYRAGLAAILQAEISPG